MKFSPDHISRLFPVQNKIHLKSNEIRDEPAGNFE